MTRIPRILLVDDEVSIQRSLAPLLQSHGYDVEIAGTGQLALTAAADHPPDLVVLDLGLPDLDGTEVCRRIREESKVPIIILSARDREADKVRALDLGADDFVTKPFGPEELLARIRVALRRAMAADDEATGQLQAGDLTIDYDRRRVVRGDDEIRLTPKEFELLSLLARNHDRVLTHRAILKAVWGPNAVNQPEHLWALVAQLRKKIEPDPTAPRYLLSEPWVGYRFTTAAQDS
ncbi:MAG: response regulator transcription factor [Vicinamibacterales bacterium]|jgi:two-component system KDP operon response regulator KdpE